MIFALDSNIISYILKDDQDVISRYSQETRTGNGFVIPPISFYEVQRWLLAKNLATKQRAFDKFCNALKIGEFSYDVLMEAAHIYAELRKRGQPIDDADVFIAAFCLKNDYTLVTNNTRHFARVEGLKLVNWKG